MNSCVFAGWPSGLSPMISNFFVGSAAYESAEDNPTLIAMAVQTKIQRIETQFLMMLRKFLFSVDC
jgi:hypothetical protein